MPILPELEVERAPDFDTVEGNVEYTGRFRFAREVRNNVATYLHEMPYHPMNEYPTSL